MPRANGGKQYPSLPGSHIAARENDDVQKPGTDELQPAPNERLPIHLTVAAATPPFNLGFGRRSVISSRTTRAGPVINDARQRDSDPIYSVPFDGWVRELLSFV